jgi:uncharacterized protein (DUF1684 family)
MKRLAFSILLSSIICGFAAAQERTAADEFQSFWKLHEKSFRDPQATPLLPDDFAKFTGLKYFAFDERFRVKARFVKTGERKSFLMPTSTGGTRKYLKIGDLIFEFDGREFSLGGYVYEWAPDHPKAKEPVIDLFIPFRDLTNGGETYSAGRYLYVSLPKSGEEAAILDFNRAYNPNCAYGNESFTCTLPPKENFLPIEIRAGEKKFSVSGKE